MTSSGALKATTNAHRSSSTSKERKRSTNSNRVRMFSGVSDIVEEYFRSEEDLQLVATEFLQILDEIPSESSEIFPQLMDPIFERHSPLPSSSVSCPECGRKCNLQGSSWKCPTKKCSANHDTRLSELNSGNATMKPELRPIKQEPDTLQESIEESTVAPIPITVVQCKKEVDDENIIAKRKIKIEIKEERPTEDAKSRKKKLIQSVTHSGTEFDEHTPRQYSLSPPTSPTCRSPTHGKETPSPQPEKKTNPRPKHYKVEDTPPIDDSGLRLCTLCKGEVRPQMCGGHKHRWRCVDKKCRKWYGWVKSGDKMPDDLGRKGRYSSILGKAKTKKKDKTSKPKKPKAKGVWTWVYKGTKNDPFGSIPHRKPVIRSSAQTNGKVNIIRPNQGGPKAIQEEERQTRACSPLSQRQLNFSPSNMERRGRWWTGERRRYDDSPERPLETTTVDIAAAMKILSLACRTAAFTRADEMGTVNGALDLMMDSLIGCLGPLLSIIATLPNVQAGSQVVNQMWDASAVHIPIFE